MARVDIPLDTRPLLPPWGHGRMRAWWGALPASLRAPVWSWSFAVLMILALLLAFHQVVRGAVRQGEVLRMAAATRSEAIWRCNALTGARVRASCLAQVDAPPTPVGEARTPPPNTARLSLAHSGR